MKLHELRAYKGERKNRKRRGRGPASGLGCTAGKGNKGQNARAGKGPAPWFEGGQMPLVRRLPKRGFKNPFRVEYEIVNIGEIAKRFKGKEEVSIEDLHEMKRTKSPIKVLGDGDIDFPLKVYAYKFSKSAVEKIQKAGGEAIALEGNK